MRTPDGAPRSCRPRRQHGNDPRRQCGLVECSRSAPSPPYAFRSIARTTTFAHRQQLQHMAKAWEELAQECMKRADAANDDNELVIDFASPKDRPKERY